MLKIARGKKRETLVKIPSYALGLGHVTQLDPNLYKPGHSHRTYDVNLDRPVSVAQRRGIRFLCENPIGAVQITNCAEAIGAGAGEWSAGFVTDDAVIFRAYEVGGPGAKGKRLTCNVGAAGTNFVSFLDLSAAPLDLGADAEEFIAFWVYVYDRTRTTQAGLSLRLTLESVTPNVDVFTFGVDATTLKDELHDASGWNFIIRRKSEAVIAGAADWTNIRRIGIKAAFNNAAGADDVFVVFDNIYLAPRYADSLFNFRQSPVRGGGNFILASARGTLAYLNVAERRFVPLATGLEPYKPMHHEVFTDFCYSGNGVDPVKVSVGDGAGGLSAATTFNAGIAAPNIAATTALQSGAGNLPAGTHEYRFEFWSSYTGLPGSSGAGAAYILTVPATAADVKIRLENLPVSTDPKVTKLRIYRRDATMERFRRVVELDNGTILYEDNVAQANLTSDLPGYPTYATNDPPPPLSMFAQIGGRMVAAGDPANPGVVYVSRPNNAEQWDLVAGPTRLDLNDNDVISSVYNCFGRPAIGKRGSNYIGLEQKGPQGFIFPRRSDVSGPISQQAPVKTDAAVFYRGSDGYYAIGPDLQPRKINHVWDTALPAPGMVGPTFDEFDSRNVENICGVYLESRGQVIWTDRLMSQAFPGISPVYHMGPLEGDLGDELGGSLRGWAFHRFLLGSRLEGMWCATEYVDAGSGKDRVVLGGAGGFIYELDTPEIDDVSPEGRVAIDADVIFAFAGQRGVALGQHNLKDYVYHDLVFYPLGYWPVDLEYYFDWLYQAAMRTVTPGGTQPDFFGAGVLPFQLGPIYAETGAYVRIELDAGRHRNVAWRIRNNRLGQSFHLSQCTWFLEYLGSEGAT